MANFVSDYTGEQIDSGINIALTNVITKDNITAFTPSENYHPATKKYVDDGVGTKVGLTGNETVAGIKTFSSFPITPSSAPTTDYQVPNKKYIDDVLSAIDSDISGINTTLSGVHSVSSGGTANQALSKINSTDYNTQWSTVVIPAASTPTSILYIWCGSQTQYNAIGTKDSNTYYIIV